MGITSVFQWVGRTSQTPTGTERKLLFCFIVCRFSERFLHLLRPATAVCTAVLASSVFFALEPSNDVLSRLEQTVPCMAGDLTPRNRLSGFDWYACGKRFCDAMVFEASSGK